jgi:hypothetical protein
MTAYVRKYDDLFRLLLGRARELVVIRVEGAPIQLFIAAFGGTEDVVIRTEAVET